MARKERSGSRSARDIADIIEVMLGVGARIGEGARSSLN
jgi:hypothetical protein